MVMLGFYFIGRPALELILNCGEEVDGISSKGLAFCQGHARHAHMMEYKISIIK